MAYKKITSLSNAQLKEISIFTKAKSENFKYYGLLFFFLVIFLFFTYHSYQIYHESEEEMKTQEKNGRDCLQKFTVDKCTPIDMSNECLQLAKCFQKSDN